MEGGGRYFEGAEILTYTRYGKFPETSSEREEKLKGRNPISYEKKVNPCKILPKKKNGPLSKLAKRVENGDLK